MKHIITLSALVALIMGFALSSDAYWTPNPFSDDEPPATPSSLGGVVNEIIIVRAYFAERGMVNYVTSWKAPWEINYEEGYMVLDVTAEEENFLINLGYTIVRDEQLSTLYSNRAKPLAGQSVTTIPGYPCYRTVEETLVTAQNLAIQHPNMATTIDIGNSWQKTQNNASGYDLVVLKLTNNQIAGPKPVVFIMSALHAREYATAELNTRLAEYLIENYGIDADATWLLDYHEFHFLLQANPDGRKQAETGILWRKNANNNYCANSNNRGVDLNRNFSFYWGGEGASTNQCDITYRGASAASEPEVIAVQNYLRSIFPDVRPNDISSPAPIDTTGVFMDLHSYGEVVLWPWGVEDPTGNDTAFKTFGRKMAYFNGYDPYQVYDWQQLPVSGASLDFAYGDLGVPAFTLELGTAFFQSCSAFEDTILPDNLEALLYMAKAARLPYQLPAGPDVVDLAISSHQVNRGELVTLTAVLDDTRYNNINGAEPTQAIAQGEIYLSQPYWAVNSQSIPLVANDGAFNSSVEHVSAVINTASLSQGQHTIFVRGRDSLNNWGVTSAIFLEVIDPLAPSLKSYTVNNGSGGVISGNGYRLQGTVGQSSVGESQADDYYHISGFWHPVLEPNLHVLNMNHPVSGLGQVNIEPTGLVCGETCTADIMHGTVVTLTAIPNAGFEFVRWSGDVTSTHNPFVFTLDSSMNIIANFAQTSRTIYLPLITRP